MKVRFFNPGLTYAKIKAEVDSEMQRVLEEGKLILQADVENFERRLAEFVGTKYAVGLNSGTDALELALRALKIGAGDEVITVSNTFKATITAIKKVGATPVLVDIKDDYLMDMEQVAKAITPKTKAVIPVHLSGDVCDMNRLFEVVNFANAQGMNIKIIEDAAQALGAEYAGQQAGSFGAVGCFSFYPAKILGSFGDAGAITTDDENLYNWIKNYRNHCKDIPGQDGMNSRMDNLQAAVLNVRFKYLIPNLARRREIANMYQDGLSHIKAKAQGTFELPGYRDGRAWQDYIIRVDVAARDHLFGVLKEQGIETMKTPILPHAELNMDVSLPKTEQYNPCFLRLPLNDNLTNEEVFAVVVAIDAYYTK